MALLIAAVVLLYCLVAILAVLVIVLYRQFGMVYLGSRSTREISGPRIGELAPSGFLVVNPLNPDQTMHLDWKTGASSGNGRFLLLIIGGPACRLCGHLLSHIPSVLAEHGGEISKVLFVDRPSPASLPDLTSRITPDGWEYWRSVDGALQDAFDITASPFIYILDREGAVRAKGLASDVQTLVTLLHSVTEMGALAN